MLALTDGNVSMNTDQVEDAGHRRDGHKECGNVYYLLYKIFCERDHLANFHDFTWSTCDQG